MERAAQVKREPVWEPGGTTLQNNRMEQSQPAFTIPSQLGKHASPLPENANSGGPAHERR